MVDWISVTRLSTSRLILSWKTTSEELFDYAIIINGGNFEVCLEARRQSCTKYGVH